ncbi:MAG: hypothetical protein HY779_00675 [Rubrobacteridae bacterium]|nr:hypothetical protein [Rubrobacteridae bacterium]
MSDSGIIVFFDAVSYKDYLGYLGKALRGETVESTISPLGGYRSLEKEWIFCIPDGFFVEGLREELKDGEFEYIRELWYVCEQLQ